VLELFTIDFDSSLCTQMLRSEHIPWVVQKWFSLVLTTLLLNSLQNLTLD